VKDARTTVINISLPERLLHLADQRARAEARTRSDFFREAVRRYLGLTTVVAAQRQTSNVAEPNMGSAGFDYAHNPTWRIFRILAEFIDGFQFIGKFEKTVTFFGSARTASDDTHYQSAEALGGLLAQAGYTVITGGGPGIMEAANKGASDAGGQSVGLNIQLPTEQRTNAYVKDSIAFNYFFTRKVIMNISAWAYVFFPGGYGTLNEFFELIELEQNGKVEREVPIILIGKDFWLPLVAWLRQNVLAKHAIAADDLELWTIVDSPEEALEIIKTTKPRPPKLYV